jgi:hypothetical protein
LDETTLAVYSKKMRPRELKKRFNMLAGAENGDGHQFRSCKFMITGNELTRNWVVGPFFSSLLENAALKPTRLSLPNAPSSNSTDFTPGAEVFKALVIAGRRQL